MYLFLDCEFTELSKRGSLISIALYASGETYFYAELNDFERSGLNDWIEENVLAKLEFNMHQNVHNETGNALKLKGSKCEVQEALRKWLGRFNNIEIWGDVPHYDWVLFCDLFGGALGIPGNIHFICRDIATLFWLKKVDINIRRMDFAGIKEHDAPAQHNALFDAYVIKACFHKLLLL